MHIYTKKKYLNFQGKIQRLKINGFYDSDKYWKLYTE